MLKKLPQRPTALVVFSTHAYSVMPLTEDCRLINDLISFLTLNNGQPDLAEQLFSDPFLIGIALNRQKK